MNRGDIEREKLYTLGNNAASAGAEEVYTVWFFMQPEYVHAQLTQRLVSLASFASAPALHLSLHGFWYPEPVSLASNA